MKNISLVLLPNPQLTTPTMYMNLGLLYIASAIKADGHSVNLIDLRGENDVKPEHVDMAIDSNFACFGATTGEIKFAKKFNDFIKTKYPEVKTVLGGPHATLYPEDCEEFDVVVTGEGEKIIGKIIAGEVTDKVVKCGRLMDLDKSLFPDWDLLPPEKMFSTMLMSGEKYYGAGRQERAAVIISSRGCPFKCAFCANCMRAPVTFRSPENVEEELRMLVDKYGITQFRFEDDTFTLKDDWFFEMCDVLEDIGISYRCHTRADCLTLDKAIAAKRSGCVEMAIGVESGDNAVLKLIRKQETVEQFTETVRIIKEVGIKSKVYLMGGLPGETIISTERTKKFIMEAKPDKWTLSQFTPYPGCDIWKRPEHYGIEIIDRNFEEYWNFPNKVVYRFLDGTTSEQLANRYKALKAWLMKNSLNRGDGANE